MKFHFSIAVWGDSFMDVFGKIHLPSLLSPGNLPAFMRSYPLEYRIYTTPEDAVKIKNLPAFKKFSAIIPTKFFEVDGIDFSDVGLTHRVFNDFMKMALAHAEAEGANIFMNNPDTCWGDGSFAHIAKLIGDGKKCILNSAIRADKEAFIDAVYSNHTLNDDGSLSISNQSLAKIGWDNIHPYQRTTVWGQEHTSLMPSPIITPVGDEGFILNMAHMGTLCTISTKLNQDFTTTTDGDYVNRVFDNPDDVHIISDSTEVCVMELSDKRRYVNNVIYNTPLDELQIAEYLLTTASWETYSLNNFRKNLTYSWKSKSRELWDNAFAETSRRNELILNLRQFRLWSKKLQDIGFDKDLLFLMHFIYTKTNFASQMQSCRPRRLNLPTAEHIWEFLNATKNGKKLAAMARMLNGAILPIADSYYKQTNAHKHDDHLRTHNHQGYQVGGREIERHYIENDIVIIHNGKIQDALVKPLAHPLEIYEEFIYDKEQPFDTWKQRYLLAGIIAHFFLSFGHAKAVTTHMLRFAVRKRYFAAIYSKAVAFMGVIKATWYFVSLILLMLPHLLRHLCGLRPSHDTPHRNIQQEDGNAALLMEGLFRSMPVAPDKLGHNANAMLIRANALARLNHIIPAFILAKLSGFVHPGHQPVEDLLLNLQTSDELKTLLGHEKKQEYPDLTAKAAS